MSNAALSWLKSNNLITCQKATLTLKRGRPRKTFCAAFDNRVTLERLANLWEESINEPPGTVFLKGGLEVKIPFSQLEQFVNNNFDLVEPIRKTVNQRRLSVKL